MKLYLFVVFIALQAVFSAPPGRVNQKPGNAGGPPEKKARPVATCHFKEIRTTKWETQKRPEKSIVSTTCSDDRLIKIADLENFPINSRTAEKNAVELLVCRGSGECDLDYSNPDTQKKWKDVHICENHADELLRKWSDSHSAYRKKHIYQSKIDVDVKEVCTMPESIAPFHKKRPHERLSYLKVSEADLLLKKFGILVQPGIPYCNHHDEFIKGLNSEEKSVTSSTIAPETKEELVADPNYKQPKTPEVSLLTQAFKAFAKASGTEKVCDARIRFGNLKEGTQQKKVCAVRKLIDVMMGIVAPEDTDELKSRVLQNYNKGNSWMSRSSKKIDDFMEQVTAQFFAAEDRTSRLIILGLVANTMPYSKIEKYIPSLSVHMYQAAKKFARRQRGQTTEPDKTKEKYNPEAVYTVIDFITSPIIMIGLPFGVRKVKMTDGSKYEIANSIRQQSKSEIFEMYQSYLKETNQEHLTVSKSSMFRILGVCAATDRKATTCVDYFIADGMEAFDGLHIIINSWIADIPGDENIFKDMNTALFEVAQYLRTDYRLHVKLDSRVPDHCALHSLSDPKDGKMATSCTSRSNSHSHDLRCVRCEHVNRTLDEIRDYSKFLIPDNKGPKATAEEKKLLEKRKMEFDLIVDYIRKIHEMKKHLLRAAVSNQERADIINDLTDNQALITLDFAQKYFPKWHREKQIDYFGKRGINYHIAHVTARIGQNLTQHSFVHIYDTEVSQNSGLVVLTLAHVASELKKVGIKKMSLRSDNAGAYHCASTIGSLYWISETFGVEIDTYTFSEAQNGKSSSDRDANRVKRKAAAYVKKGRDITTAEEFFAALQFGKSLNGVSVHHGSVTVLTNGETKWSGISNYNHFTLEKNGIRAKRYGNIGVGTVFEKSSLKPLTGTYSFKEAGYVASSISSNLLIDEERKAVSDGTQTKFWYHYGCPKESKCMEEDDITPEIDETPTNPDVIGNLFACPEPGCSASFLKVSNLGKHHLTGKHKISPERLNMMDFSLNYYVERLEEVEKTRILPLLKDALENQKKTSTDSDLPMGWALPVKQTRVPFDADVKKFLIECFDEGAKKGGKHLDPKTVEQRMVTEKKADGSLRFLVSQRKTMRQIASFFSREAEKRRSAIQSNGRHRRAQEKKTEEEDEYIDSEDDHPDAGWLRWVNDEATPTVADEYFFAIINSQDPLFDYSEKDAEKA